MEHFKILPVVCVLCISFAWAQDQFNLSGTIINQANFQVFGMICELKDAGLRDTSDSSGAFTVTGSATAIAHKINREAPIPQFRGSQLIIPVTSGAQPVSVEVYNLKGLKVATLFNRILTQGEHTVPFTDRIVNHSQSVLVAVVKCGSDISRFRVVKAGGRQVMVQEIKGSAKNGLSAATAASNPLQVIDSLRFIRCLTFRDTARRIVEFTIPITTLDDEFEVTLDLIPYEALTWAETQVGRSNETAGEELGKPGSGIYPYEFQTYWNGAWCSEWHCYIMRIGGCPLGDDGGTETRPHWLKLGHDQLERWYTSNSDQETEFIPTEDIESSGYYPVTGDFVHVSGHTTTVHYMEGDILYTLGGNEGDEVKLARRGNYKNWSSSLWGYGRRSGVVQDSFRSVK